MNFEDCKIIRKKIKNSSIKIEKTWIVLISVPRFCLPGYPKKLFESKKDWIEKKLEEIKNNKIIQKLEKWKILYLWEIYNFNYDTNSKKDLINSENRIIISNKDLNNSDTQDLWYKKIAKDYLNKKTIEIAKKDNFIIKKITIRNQKTRWWSCSGKNNISLNWRLIKCPVDIIDYIIYHELTHTIEKNHSSKFWTKLESYNSNCKESRKWLKVNWNEMFL